MPRLVSVTPPSASQSGESVPIRARTANPATATTNPPLITRTREYRRASAAAPAADAPISTDGARHHSAAVSGLRPSTDCRYWVEKRTKPMVANITRVLTVIAPLNPRSRNSPRSINGSAAVRSRRRNTRPTATPSTIASTGSAPNPSAAPRFRP